MTSGLEPIATARPLGEKIERLLYYGNSRVVFSPDGKLVAATVGPSWPALNEACVVVWNISQPNAPHDIAQLDGRECAAFTPDGRLAYGGDRYDLVFYDPRSGEYERLSLRDLPEREWYEGPRRLQYAPSGRLAIATVRGLVILDPSGALVPLPRKHQNTILGIAWSRDEETLYTLDPTFLRVWNVGGREQVKRISLAHRGDLVMAPDGAWLATGGERLERHPLRSRLPTKLRVLAKGRVDSIALSPDGTTLAVASPTSLRLVRTGKATRMRELRLEDGHYAPGVAFSPDGKLLAAVRNGSLTLYSLG